jgi:hypothetical protein
MCELVLNGIGGSTLVEARQRLTHAEICVWAAYVEKRGTLNLGMRLEIRTAEIMLMMVTAAGVKKRDGTEFKIDDFVLHRDGFGNDIEEEGISFDDAIKQLGKII